MLRTRSIRGRSFPLAGVPVQDFRALLIEDNGDEAFLLARCFEKIGLPRPLAVLPSGDAAVAYLAGEGIFQDRARHPLPSLVIVHLHLPGRSGFKVVEWIRSRPELNGLPVFAWTSSLVPDDAARALALGVDACFPKPSTLPGLLQLSQEMALLWSRLRERFQPV